MVLGNKCDINDKRQVSKDRGENVRRGFNKILPKGYILIIKQNMSTDFVKRHVFLSARVGVWNKVHGDQRKGQHQCGKCK